MCRRLLSLAAVIFLALQATQSFCADETPTRGGCVEDLLKSIFTTKIQYAHPELSYESFRKKMPVYGFDLKLKPRLLVNRLKEVYDDPTRIQYFKGIPIQLQSNGKTIDATLRAFWMNEYSMLGMTDILNHPTVTVHPTLNEFIQKIYKASFKDIPDEVFNLVEMEDTRKYPLASGWVVISDNSNQNIIATARVHFSEFERGLDEVLPLPIDDWVLPMEYSLTHGGHLFLTPEHRTILIKIRALVNEMETDLKTAPDNETYNKLFDGYRDKIISIHRENQVGEIGRLAKDPSYVGVDIIRPVFSGIQQLMRQKNFNKVYFYTVTPAHDKYYQRLFYAPWNETGVLETIRNQDGKVLKTIYSLTDEQIGRYIKAPPPQ
jgi:hypothetical protein